MPILHPQHQGTVYPLFALTSSFATVAEIEFAEWTPDERLRHAAFVSLRSDKKAAQVVKEE